jgi:hypothetical protein
MPRPVFIITAKGTTEDKVTNSLSIFYVVETLDVILEPRADVPQELLDAANEARFRSQDFVALAVWMREDDDDAVFEHEFALIFPDREDQIPAQPFQFNRERPLQRFKLQMTGVPLPRESCVVEIESRVHRRDTNQHWQQRYPLICNVRQLEAHGHADG